MTTYDIAIVGSGFAGSILARILNRQGLRVLLLEKGTHPRFAIGESTTPLANLVLERLARRYELPDLLQLATHGRWLQHLPHLRRGLKRGFTFYRHRRGTPFSNSEDNEARLLVAASPDDRIADTHWLRADIDHHLVTRAVAEGVDYRDRTEVEDVEISDVGVKLLATTRDRRRSFDAGVVVDASGRRSVLSRALPIASDDERLRVHSSLLFSHFEGLRPFDEVARAGGATLEPGPYPDETAAVHHLLDEGWLYVLPFDHGVASAGVILRRSGERSLDAEIRRDPAAAWGEILGRYPSLAAQFADARPLLPVRYVERIQHRLEHSAGPRWFLLPHAYAFYDPLFSTGIAWSLLAIERLARLLGGNGNGNRNDGDGDGDWRAYGQLLRHEADQLAHLVEAAYLAMPRFDHFVAVSFLYFASVSFAEVRQRLTEPAAGEPPWAWEGFLGASDPSRRALFAEAVAQLRAGVGVEQSRAFRRFIAEAIEPFNIAGLGDPRRRNLYPVDLDVLVDRAHLLGLDRQTVLAALSKLRGIE